MARRELRAIIPVDMRTLPALLICLPAIAPAWEFTPVPICTLSHVAREVETVVTYDPAIGEYAIALTLSSGRWPPATVFGIRFEGSAPNLIVTDNHEIAEADGATLTVRDSGFGNVLNGLEFNTTALAMIGSTTVAIPLEGAAPAVSEFRACLSAPSV